MSQPDAQVKHLLIVYHTKTGNTGQLAEAVLKGTQCADAGSLNVRFKTAALADASDLLWADALLLGTPENFGYMSGALKDFFDRTFYEVENQLQPLSCAIFISAGNDGEGALRHIRRIIKGYPFVEVQPPVVAQGEVTASHLASAEALGSTLALGLEVGIY